MRKSSALRVIGLYCAAVLGASVPSSSPAVDRVIDATAYMAENNTTIIAESTSHGHVKRTPGNLYLCTDIGFTGYCVLITGASSGHCVNLGPDLNDLVTSFGPDSGQSCSFFLNARCAAGKAADVVQNIRSPGISDLSQIGFDNTGSSYACIFDGGQTVTVTWP
ncbi:hypothetical protein C8R43DRAFT_505956 [Mycena crocata]|nr:hypothetical protein C8R43DRAFT_505956 [Mycena crocata]